MTSEGMGEMFDGDSADTSAGKFPLMLMGGRAEGLVCEDPEARTPKSVSKNCFPYISVQDIGVLCVCVLGRGVNLRQQN